MANSSRRRTSESYLLHAVLGIPFNGTGVSGTCGEILNGILSPDIVISCISPRVNTAIGDKIKTVQTLPWWGRWPIPYRLVKKFAASRTEEFVRELAVRSGKGRVAVYAWANISVELAQTLSQHGILSIREATNCHQGTAKTILDHAYERVGLAPSHGISEKSVEDEKKILAAMDYIFCPNNFVRESMLQNDVPDSKLLSTSYGWSPSRLLSTQRKVSSSEGLTFAFVGSISVGKGAHLLMEYWARSGVKGRLVMAGVVEPAIIQLCQKFLEREDIIVPGYIKEIGAIYRAADVFVFPTLVEGGPQVTYEAAGCGLPVVTSPMGAGRIIQNGFNGYILDPYDADGWIETFRTLASSSELRKRLSNSARESASQFTWSEVGKQRRNQLLKIFRSRLT